MLIEFAHDFKGKRFGFIHVEEGDSIPTHPYYALGYEEPHYPMPATVLNADLATTHYWLTGHCPHDNGPCLGCISEFIDALEYYMWED